MNTTHMPIALETTIPDGFIEASAIGDELTTIAASIAARSIYSSDRDEVIERIQSITESIPSGRRPPSSVTSWAA